MSETGDPFELTRLAAGRYAVSGALGYSNAAPVLRAAGRVLAAERGGVLFDLASVTRTDSAGLAVLIECLRLAKQQGLELVFQNLPQQLEKLAAVSGVEALLPRPTMTERTEAKMQPSASTYG